jgi:hypothetical protein
MGGDKPPFHGAGSAFHAHHMMNYQSIKPMAAHYKELFFLKISGHDVNHTGY